MPQPNNPNPQHPTQMEPSRYVLELFQRDALDDDDQENVPPNPVSLALGESTADLEEIVSLDLEATLPRHLVMGFYPNSFRPGQDATFQLYGGREIANADFVRCLFQAYIDPEFHQDFQITFQGTGTTLGIGPDVQRGSAEGVPTAAAETAQDVRPDVQPESTADTTAAAPPSTPQAPPENIPPNTPTTSTLSTDASTDATLLSNVEPYWGAYAHLRSILPRQKRIPLGELVGPSYSNYSSETLLRVQRESMMKLGPAVWGSAVLTVPRPETYGMGPKDQKPENDEWWRFHFASEVELEGEDEDYVDKEGEDVDTSETDETEEEELEEGVQE